jgi:hypothetical protein
MRIILGATAIACLAVSLTGACGGKSDASFNPTKDGGADSGGASGSGGTTGGTGGTGGAGGSVTGGSGGTGATSGAGGSSTGGDGGAAGTAGSGGTGGSGASAGAAGSGGTSATGGSGGSGSSGGSGAPSPNAGTEFWAVDLPNERYQQGPVADPWALLITNVGAANTTITIEQNNAPLGSPPSLTTTATVQLTPGEARQVDMPTREVSGWTPSTADPPGPPMTHLSSSAFRIRSTQPIAIVQINNTSGFSTDASLLVPRNALGTSYRVIGWPAANPTSPMPIESVPDHSSITVVGLEDGTNVSISVSNAVLGDGSTIDDTPANGTVTVTLGAFDVLNLASDGEPGDLSGSLVSASKPVAVFSSNERAIGPVRGTVGFPFPPGITPTDNCCTDHVEEQLFPVSALGKHFVLPHSPWRSTGAFKEADLVRFVGGMTPAQVTTNLPAPHASFTLQPGMVHDAFTTGETRIEATTPILVAQVLASAMATTRNVGDPSLTVIPPVDHHRNRFTFLVPEGWAEAHVTVAAPAGTTLQLDGLTPSGCNTAPIGTVEGIAFDAHRCPVSAGARTLVGSAPFGVIVYGYDTTGSFAYAAAGM